MKRYIIADIIDYHDEDPEGQVDFAQNTTRPENLRKLAESDNEDILIAVAGNPNTPEDVRNDLIGRLHLGTRFEFPFMGDWSLSIEIKFISKTDPIFTAAGYEVLDAWVTDDDYSLADYGILDDDAVNQYPSVFKVVTTPVFDDNVCNELMGKICQILSDEFNCTPFDPGAWFCNTESNFLYI